MKTTKGNIIITFDDIIIETSFILYLFMSNNFSYYKKYFDLTKLYNRKTIYERNDKDILKLLYSKKIFESNELNLKEKQCLLISAITDINSRFYNKDFYNISQLTSIGKTVLLNPLFYENSGIENIYILIKYNTQKEKEYKESFLKKIINNQKFKLIFIKYDSKYIDAFKNISNWNLVITDDIELVEDLSKGNIDHKEFYIPNYGYTKASNKLKELIKLKYSTITYYNAI